MGLGVRPGNKTTVFSVEKSIISTPKQGQTSSFQFEAHGAFFSHKHGIVHYEFLPKGNTMNRHFYSEALLCVCEDATRKRPEKWCTGDCVLHSDSAAARSTLSMQERLVKNGVTVVPHPS
jgi:hypothetical protein